MTNSHTLLSLFETCIAVVKIQENTDILQTYDVEWYDEGWKEYGCSRASKSLRVLESYPEIKKILLDTFTSFSSEILGLENKFEISTSWITKCEKGDNSPLHSHGNCFWSGICYYGEKYCTSSSLIFQHPLFDYIKNYGCSVDPKRKTRANKMIEIITPSKNTLILFPSYLKHGIQTHKSNFHRYSLAFNIVPIGEYGSHDNTYNTSWFI